MTRRRKIAVATLVFITAAITVVSIIRSREPRFEGRTHNYWIGKWVREGHSHAESVLLQIGATNRSIWVQAMDEKRRFVIDGLKTKDSFWWRPYTGLKKRTPALVSKWLPDWPEPAESRLAAVNLLASANLARDSFWTEAVPTLCNLAKKDASPLIRLAAIAAIGNLRLLSEQAMPVLCDLAEKDPNPEMRSAAIQGISRLGDPSAAAVPRMLKALTSDRSQDRESAAKWFGKTTLVPERVVPELVRLLEDPGMKSDAARALAQYGSRAQFAVPHLVELSKTNDPAISSVAKWALFGIDREAAAEAGIKQY